MLDYTTSREGDVYVSLRDLNRLSHVTGYTCSYSHTATTGSCLSNEVAEEFIGKKAIFGWYQLEDSTVFSNPKRQLVTVEINGKMIKEYEQTVQILKNQNIGMLGIAIFFTLFSTWIFEKIVYPKNS